ncbi:hypothetical protein Kyoto22A_12810 [Helicobacter pylori]
MKNQQKEKDQTPYKIALFKNLNLVPSFSLTKKVKKDFSSNPPKKRVQKERVLKERVLKERELKKRGFKKRDFKKKSLKKRV